MKVDGSHPNSHGRTTLAMPLHVLSPVHVKEVACQHRKDDAVTAAAAAARYKYLSLLMCTVFFLSASISVLAYISQTF